MTSDAHGLRLGCGIYDITGPAAERAMLGYASPFQQTGGIHMRLRSRAFVFEIAGTEERLAFVSADLCMITQAVKTGVVEKLLLTCPGRFSDGSVILSATHTHAGPGGYSHYTLYDLSTVGFDEQNFRAIVDGIAESIHLADIDLGPGRAFLAEGELEGLSKNRSPKAYERNPQAERDLYGHGRDTDDSMTVLRLEKEGVPAGMICWYAIHGTSLDNGNHLISGDNKGYASYLFERLMGESRPEQALFVAAFAQSNEGDISPNIYYDGPHGRVPHGRGPDQFVSMETSGRRQFEAARDLYETQGEELGPRLASRHVYVDMANLRLESGETTCDAAIGVSMLAGTEDGRGLGWEGVSWSFLQRIAGRLGIQLLLFWLSHPWQLRVLDLWFKLVRGVGADKCQGDKVSVIPTGSFSPPWSPRVLPLQVARIGSLGIVAVPFELTTMAGRRLRRQVLKSLQPAGVTSVVIAGLSNAYAGYVTTHEEYGRQDYEGASTHFGPLTLAAVQQISAQLGDAIAAGSEVPSPAKAPLDPPEWLAKLSPGVLLDVAPPGRRPGKLRVDAEASYQRGLGGRSKVVVSFWAGHPKNNLRIEGTFLEVERLADGLWNSIARDSEPETRFIWRRWPAFFSPFSTATVEWQIPPDAAPGHYRVRIHGDRRPLVGGVRPYTGTSREFEVI